MLPFFVNRGLMSRSLEQVYASLYRYASARGFAGWDPFDGLESRIFQALPFRQSRSARLAWLQIVKRSPVNLRPLLLVPRGVNPKALALFAFAELSRYRATAAESHASNARELIDRMLKTRIEGDGWSAFGYNFDWQSRVLFAPRGTPAVVPTAFACRALLEACDALDDDSYLGPANEICKFIVSKLNRPVEDDDAVCFSYTPLDRTRVFNASLLAAECLAGVGSIAKNDEYLQLAASAVRFVIRHQRSDGAWSYGDGAHQGWVDNFHTAYVLLSLRRIARSVPEIAEQANRASNVGRAFWLDNLFLPDGTPKYYEREVYPVDIHSAGVAIAAAAELGEIELGNRLAAWTCRNMLDPDGFFYYRVGRVIVDETPFMRWGQAWMAYALARLIEAQ